MKEKNARIFKNGSYLSVESSKETKAGKLSFFKTFSYYTKVIKIVLDTRKKILKGSSGFDVIYDSSIKVFDCIEKTGCKISIKGLDFLKKEEAPVVIVSNHMSTLETFLFPFIVGTEKNCSFVVKRSLVTGPVFGPIMRSLNPIAVDREDARKDLDVVMKEGTALLEKGTSVILFPQAKRDPVFKPENFNSLGIKLAKRAGVKVIPCAIKTDFWENGKVMSTFGHLYPERTVYFEFGEAVEINGAGKKEHKEIIDFILRRVNKWNK